MEWAEAGQLGQAAKAEVRKRHRRCHVFKIVVDRAGRLRYIKRLSLRSAHHGCQAIFIIENQKDGIDSRRGDRGRAVD